MQLNRVSEMTSVIIDRLVGPALVAGPQFTEKWSADKRRLYINSIVSAHNGSSVRRLP